MSEPLTHDRKLWDSIHQKGYQGYSFNTNLDDVIELLPENYLKPHMRILEIGCGRGDYLKRFSPLVGEVHGIDVSREAIKLSWINLWWTHNTYPTVCNGETIPYPDNYFDFLYEISVFQHIPRKYTRNYLKEAHRCLKPGGYMAIQVISRLSDGENHGDIVNPVNEETIGYTLDDIRDVIINGGLKLIKVKKHLFETRNNVYWYKLLCVKEETS